MNNTILTIILLIATYSNCWAQKVTDYVDPRIGSEGLGRTFIGPCCPYGMCKPGPDCGVSNNAGWAPMPAEVSGFSQTHVSGTGGGPKYGNILVMPFDRPQHRTNEDVRLGYYACDLLEANMKVEITTAERAAFYRYTTKEQPLPNPPQGGRELKNSQTHELKNSKTQELKNSRTQELKIDLQHFLGRNPVPKAREAQQYESSEQTVVNDSVITGWQCISGGWNNGAPYTVYFYSLTKHEGSTMLHKIGISYVSIEKAEQNMREDIPHWSFDTTYQECIDKWERLLSRVQLADDTPLSDKRMLYTALYHTMIMPVDRTHDNGLYDDYYAIWDTYRTSTPLITLLDPQREEAIVTSLLDIYDRDGYMPDARSGNSNGRTQGGSNANIVIADALAKGLNIDYHKALDAMLKDATVPPVDDEAEGRGGLAEYNALGYIPYGIARAGTRTVEYSFCDWAIAQVAKYLSKNCCPKDAMTCDLWQGYDSLYHQYMRQSERWQNIWRMDYEHDGVRGFIMPRSATGEWHDDAPFGHSKRQQLQFRYTPDVSYEGPWYCAWWDCYFYEASSWEYSFSVPHDVPKLIEMCGGRAAFERRLDTFFAHGYYNVANEPSFLTPCLYHWIGKPELTSQRVEDIVRRHYADTPMGIPGNDDSGSMSSWLVFHMLGLYPNAGHDYYIVHKPLVNEATINLTNGKALTIKRLKGKKPRATLNGMELKDWFVTHQQLLHGGMLTVTYVEDANRTNEPNKTNETNKSNEPNETNKSSLSAPAFTPQYLFTYSLHGQTRKFDVAFTEESDTLTMHWSIVRNLKRWYGTYRMLPEARTSATSASYTQPMDQQHITLPPSHLFAVLSQDALNTIKSTGICTWCNTHWRLADKDTSVDGTTLLHLIDTDEGAEMWVEDNPRLPLIHKMVNNPAEINWTVNKVR